MSDYPTDRKRCGYSIRFIRALLESDAIRDYGTEPVLLAVFIASREDRLHYAKPPRFWRSELMDKFGRVSPKDFLKVRNEAVKAGLLFHKEGTRKQPGLYWTLVPDWLRPRFEAFPKRNGTEPTRSQNGTEQGTEQGTELGTEQGTLSIPYTHIPITHKKRRKLALSSNSFSASSFEDLSSWIDWWNGLHQRSLVHASTKDSQANRKSLKKANTDPDLASILSDRSKLEKAIQESSFVRGGWFTLGKLLSGKNKDGEFIAQRLLDGGYRDAKSKTVYTEGANFNPSRKVKHAGF